MALSIRHFTKTLLPLGLAALIAGCGSLEPPEKSGELVVGILDDPVSYLRQAADGDEGGFDRDLVLSFAESRKLKVRFVPVASVSELESLLNWGKIHFAAGMPMVDGSGYRYTGTVRQARQLVVQHSDALPLDAITELAGRTIETLPGDPEKGTLNSLPVSPALTMREAPVNNGIDLLARIADGKSDLAAIDSAHFDLALNFYPDLAVAWELPSTVSYTWAFRPGDEALRHQAEEFLAGARDNRLLARIEDRYFGHIKRISPAGAGLYIEHIRARLPEFRRYFEEAAALNDIDWRLLAALAYQESGWSPLATSFTNVRGIMMLTEDTADHFGVTDRLDPRQSILGGARYLSDLIRQMPASIKGQDRYWFALAAYNLGQGHLNGARQIAAGMKRDADSWYEMKRVLPLMARPEYYARLKSGRARGGEAVIMVENIRSYYDILCRFAPPYAGPSFSRPPT